MKMMKVSCLLREIEPLPTFDTIYSLAFLYRELFEQLLATIEHYSDDTSCAWSIKNKPKEIFELNFLIDCPSSQFFFW